MKELNKRYKDIIHGETVTIGDLNPRDYWDTFEALKGEYFLGQYTLDGGLAITAKTPVEKPLPLEQAHLTRPIEKNGSNKTFSCSEILKEQILFQKQIDEKRLQAVREELVHERS